MASIKQVNLFQNVDGRGLPRKKVVARFQIGEIKYRLFEDGTLESCWRGLVLFH